MFKIKTYLIQLDIDNYGWSFLWNSTIHEIQKYCNHIEIVTVILPILAVETDEHTIELLNNIEGIKTIEPDNEGFLCFNNTLDNDTLVSCTNCINHGNALCDKDTIIHTCKDCICGNCADCSNPESAIEFRWRQGYIQKESDIID